MHGLQRTVSVLYNGILEIKILEISVKKPARMFTSIAFQVVVIRIAISAVVEI